MRHLIFAAGLAAFTPAALAADPEAIRSAAYDGRLTEEMAALEAACDAGDTEACLGAGLGALIGAYEGLAQGVYRHGAVAPGTTAAALLMGLSDGAAEPVPANPSPEPLSYAQLRDILDSFVTGLDTARARFEQAGASGDYVLTLEPLRVPFDLNGDGRIDAGETLAPLFSGLLASTDNPADAGAGPSPAAALDLQLGLDRADGFWLAGYTQIIAAPVDWLLAHDFSRFFDAYMHRVFPQAGLPLQEFVTGSGAEELEALLDAETSIGIADMIAGIHALDFPVVDAGRLAGVRTRLKSVTALSRQNWQAILAETDDDHELLPSPQQTPPVPDAPVTQAHIDAWMATLDSVDKVLDGELLLPHWRFAQGFDLRAYFETAERTDLVLLLTGLDALPYLKDGPVASAADFEAANATFGDQLFPYAIWFN